MKEDGERGQDTRARLLEAAGEVFARCGFRGATVREISKCADANIAAVNYHFGDKGGLYAAVLSYSLESAFKKYPPDLGLGSGADPEDRLRAFIRSLLCRILDEGRPAWHGKLMAMELAQPTAVLDQIVEKVIGPLYKLLVSIVGEMAGDGATDQGIHLCSLSIFGQCLFYRHSRAIIPKLYPLKLGSEEVDLLTDHIARFSLAGMRLRSKEDRPKTPLLK